ncbi:unnamed protein product [Amoebophrya sp. A120]|nr:unnamed protein product [Amoebophrya sp. A120]|eukprot:GSA120T00008136001.1
MSVMQYAKANRKLFEFFNPTAPAMSFKVLTLYNDFCWTCEREYRVINPPLPLLKLPVELINKVSSYLPLSGHHKLSMVCKALRADLRAPWKLICDKQKKEDDEAAEMQIWKKN